MAKQYQLVLGAVVLACALSPGQPARAARTDQERNNAVCAEAKVVALALEKHRNDHNGAYPSTSAAEKWLEKLVTLNYLPHKRLTPSPWGGATQHESLGIAGLPLASAHMQASRTGTRSLLAKIHTHLGVGHQAIGGKFDGLTFGAILYDYDVDTYTYMLYGVGREGNQATVVFAQTNDR